MMLLLRVSLFVYVLASAAFAAEPAARYEYRLLATSRTSTMEKEMNAVAESGFRYAGAMGGETGFAGNEVVVVMVRMAGEEPVRRTYRLLATSKTSTMQQEMQQAGDEGFEYKGQTVFESAFSGREVAVIMERAYSSAAKKFAYRLLATSRTSTMEKELSDAGRAGFLLLGVTVAKTAFGGSEVVSIAGKEVQ
jgi:hypothetical protein